MTKGDEAAAMAAMFQAQTANWEETQEKMSQLVSPLIGFFLSYVVPMSHKRDLFFPLLFFLLCVVLETVPPASTIRTLAELDSLAAASRILLTSPNISINSSPIDLYHQVISAIDVD